MIYLWLSKLHQMVNACMLGINSERAVKCIERKIAEHPFFILEVEWLA